MILNEVTKAILSRRTVRSFTPVRLTSDEVKTLLECAMWAPSGRNSQNCYVRVISDKTALDELNTDFKDTVGRDTPAYTRWDVNPVYQTAPALFCIFADCPDPMNGGIMAENICIAAQGMGLNSCIIGSVGALFDGERAQSGKINSKCRPTACLSCRSRSVTGMKTRSRSPENPNDFTR